MTPAVQSAVCGKRVADIYFQRGGLCIRLGVFVCEQQWSNYSIFYEGAVKYGEPRKYFEAPEAPPKVISGIKMFFYCNFSTKKTCKLQ